MYLTSQAAEMAFYTAFEQADVGAMMQVWADNDRIVCLHPGASRFSGVVAVRQSWVEILGRSEERLVVMPVDQQYFESEHLSVHHLREQLCLDGEIRGVMLAINVYERIEGSWRLMLHQATPDPAASIQTMPTNKVMH